MTPSDSTWIHGPVVLLPDGPSRACLEVRGTQIISVASEPDRGQTIVDLGQRGYLAPGLVDTHLHGALGRDVMEASPDALDIISRFLVRHGVTTWLPTTLACPASELTLTLQAVRARMNLASHPGAKVAGAHLESNFLAARHVGAQPPEYLASPSDPRLRKVLELHVDAIRIVTLAPELPEALDLVRWLVSKGIVVSIGHTDATHDQVLEASRAGASRITHLCNAQRGLHHREPGVVGAALTQDTLTCEVIADGIHIHPVVLDLIARCKGPQGTALVTDSLPGTGLGPGLHAFGNRQVRIHDGVARLDDGTLAGSILTLDAAVRHAVKWMRVDVQAAIRMASETPARSAGLLDIGTLEPGKRADLVWFDDDIGVQRTWIDGQLVHQLEGLTP